MSLNSSKTVTMPTADIMRANCSTFSVGKFEFYFSYRTLIAFNADGQLFVRENAWGATTGKHLNAIDGGSKEAKAKRLCSEVFESAYLQHVASYVD